MAKRSRYCISALHFIVAGVGCFNVDICNARYKIRGDNAVRIEQ